jgi:hypothetical protein
MLYFSTTSSYGELFANRQERAYYVGESGANYALQKFITTPVANGPFPTLTTFTLSNGQFAVKTYDKPGDTNPSDYRINRHRGIWLADNQATGYQEYRQSDRCSPRDASHNDRY